MVVNELSFVILVQGNSSTGTRGYPDVGPLNMSESLPPNHATPGQHMWNPQVRKNQNHP